MRFSSQGSLENIFFKILPMTNFWSKQSQGFCVDFPEYDFNFVTQKFVKKQKHNFQKIRTFMFGFQVAFLKMLSRTVFDINSSQGLLFPFRFI